MYEKSRNYNFLPNKIMKSITAFSYNFSSEKKWSDRLFYMAFYLCLGFFPPFIGLFSIKAFSVLLILISTLVVLRFFMREDCQKRMIACFKSPPMILFALFVILLCVRAIMSVLGGAAQLYLLTKPLMFVLIGILFCFVWSHSHIINQKLLFRLVMVGFWIGLLGVLLKVIAVTSIGFNHHQNMAIFLQVHFINTELTILFALSFLVFFYISPPAKQLFYFIGLYFFIFILTFFIVGFLKSGDGYAVTHVGNETVQFAIPLVLLILISSYKYPKRTLNIIFSIIIFVFATAPWLYQFAYSVLQKMPYLPKARKLLVRFEIWDGVGQKITEAPFWGFGVESLRYLKKIDLANHYIASDALLHPHNVVLQLWLNFGLLGILMAIGFLFLSWRALYKTDPAKLSALLTGIVILFAVILVTHSFWHIWFLALITNLVILIKIGSYPKDTRKNNRPI